MYMTTLGYKLRHAQTCHIQTQQTIYSCAEGHVMSLFSKDSVNEGPYIPCLSVPLHLNV